jgi:hypothetical protein
LDIAKKLREFLATHDVYSWHRANVLSALYKVAGPKSVADICRNWLSDPQQDWYLRTIAARILIEVPRQHAYLTECLQNEQEKSTRNAEETAILRQELAFGAFQRIKSPEKQLTLFRIICRDASPIVRRLAVYLLQQPECKVKWDNLKPFHKELSIYSELIQALGISPDAPRPCLISQTLSTMYNVSRLPEDLRPLYLSHYDKAVEHLRSSVVAFHDHRLTDEYISNFHQFIHLTLVAFYQQVLPSESGLFDGYAALTDRKAFSEKLPRGLDTWKTRLGPMRNRVEHPIDKNTKLHSTKITNGEVEYLFKQLPLALQELFDVWLRELAASGMSGMPITTP